MLAIAARAPAAYVALLISALTLLLAPTPEGMSEEAWRVAIVALLMAAWWMLEAAPLAATALLPIVLFPFLGVRDLAETASAYANPLIFLFLGGFMLAAAMERWELHRRVALAVIAVAGGGPRVMILAVMGATAFLSLWISNTATAMVMTPIAASLARAPRGGDPAAREIDAALMLGVAYAATIGGMGSLIGTPPNALLAGHLQSAHGIEIGFGEWMLIGVPIVAALLPLAWLMLTRIAFQVPSAAPPPPRAPAPLSPLTREQALVAIVLTAAAAAWIARPWLAAALEAPALSDAGIAVAAAVFLFLCPARGGAEGGGRLLEWDDLKNLRWDVLILFGGGLALADAIAASGLADWLSAVVAQMRALPTALVVLVMMVAIVYLGELASNTAMAAVFLPIATAIAVGAGLGPMELALPVALAASLGFMLPVATPPNAIVYGSGRVTGAQMIRAGAPLDVLSILVVYLFAIILGPLL